jgi:hypothetical protein
MHMILRHVPFMIDTSCCPQMSRIRSRTRQVEPIYFLKPALVREEMLPAFSRNRAYSPLPETTAVRRWFVTLFPVVYRSAQAHIGRPISVV